MTKSHLFFEQIQIDELSSTPKYLQLANAIIDLLKKGVLVKDDLLPSINEVNYMFEISRDTVEKSYRYLKKNGLVGSFPGKGYYIASGDLRDKRHIILLFNKLSGHKKIIYDAFVKAMGPDTLVDLYVYNNDFILFKRILQNRKRDYDNYVIIPHFVDGGGDKVGEILRDIPKAKLLILDKLLPVISDEYAAVYEDFSKDIYTALEEALPLLGKYHTLKLIFPDKSYYPKDIIKGFYRFCQQYAFEHWLVADVTEEEIQQGEVYINLMEDDLIALLDRVIDLGLEVGKDVGVISYNETPMKKYILNGITTISTDFEQLGKMAAELILTNSTQQVAVPFSLKVRASI
ncbi:GntR family transcriptional regulator [Olivibacter sitiensis]|uniref:GntR family transcriptional regulator n=1 Tax=Olivibacter sitiensis TaxID=376470 RepID=UPI0004246DB6|nr:GntR family transcriptional regulator [Olivibacter sitiensis]